MSDDPRRFNIRTPEDNVLCPACGFPDYFTGTSYGEKGPLIGTGICPCCLWEPGFDDDPSASPYAATIILDSLRHYRRDWAAVYAWRGNPALKPADWDGRAQLERLLAVAPFMA